MSDPIHSFNTGHAKIYGLRESILIHNLHFWVSNNHANGTHEHDGRTWTYNSVKAFEALFPYLTYKQIRTSLETLITLDVLVRGHYSKNPADRSSWFAFSDSFLTENPLPERKLPTKKKVAPSALQGTPLAPQGKCPSALEGTPSALEGKSLEEQIVNADVNIIPAAPAAPPTAVEADAVATESAAKKAAAEKAAADKKVAADKADELQVACRATWVAYVEAYTTRYGTQPVRNAKVNSNVKDFVKRLGYDESPAVAEFFVKSINDVFVVRSCHPVGSLLQNAEAYRTQWATGRTAQILTTPAETTYQRSMRERAAEFAPDIARKAPGEAQKLPQTPVEFFQAIEVQTLRISR